MCRILFQFVGHFVLTLYTNFKVIFDKLSALTCILPVRCIYIYVKFKNKSYPFNVHVKKMFVSMKALY